MLASVTSRAKRSGRIAASGRPSSPSPRRDRLTASPFDAGAGALAARCGRLLLVQLAQALEPLAQLGGQLRRARQARVDAEPENPGDEAARVRVSRQEQHVALLERPQSLGQLVPFGGLAVELGRVQHLARSARSDVRVCQAIRSEIRIRASPQLLAELPVGAVGVGAGVEVAGTVEVVLRLRRVGDLALDPRQPEHADRLALVRVAEQVELAALEQQVVRVDLARRGLVATHRVVVEHDRLVAEDRGLDLRQPRRELVASGRRGDAERDRALLGRAQRARTAPRDLLQREPQRLRVGEFAVEKAERGLQRGELFVREGDRGQVEVLGPQRVVLLLGGPVGGALDRELDPQRLELGAVRVEAPREGVLVHAAVALDVAPDLQGGDRAPLGHQVGDQRQLADQLLGVLCHRLSKIEAGDERSAPAAGRRPRYLRRFRPLRGSARPRAALRRGAR